MREISQEKFDGWIAYKSLCLSDDWLQMGILAAVINNRIEALTAVVVSALGGDYKPQMLGPNDFIPGHKATKRSKGNVLRGQSMANALKGLAIRS